MKKVIKHIAQLEEAKQYEEAFYLYKMAITIHPTSSKLQRRFKRLLKQVENTALPFVERWEIEDLQNSLREGSTNQLLRAI